MRDHDLPIRAPGYRHRDDVGDPSGTAGWMRRKRGQPPILGPLTRQWRGDRLLLSAGEGPLTPPHWVGEGSRIAYCGPQAPTEWFRAVLQEVSFLCKARLASLGCMQSSVTGGGCLVQVKDQKSVGTSLTHPPVKLDYEALSSTC